MDWSSKEVWWTAVAAGVSLLASVGGLLVVRWVVVSLPDDYFVADQASHDWRHRHPLVRWSWLVLKNALGAVLLVAGVTMLVTPGPGVLAILLGLSLVSLPGKRALVLRMLRNRHVLSAINALRAGAQRPPLIMPGQH